MKRKIAFILLLAVTVLQANAVLKESNLAQTLVVLRSELSTFHQEQVQYLANFEVMSKQYDKQIMGILNKCHQIELMLYSQKSDYIFDETYACNEATTLYNKLNSDLMPFDTFEQKMNEKIKQYNLLTKALNEIPEFALKDPKLKANRDSCYVLARLIAIDLTKMRNGLNKTQERTQRIINKAKVLNDYAVKQYEEIRKSVFVNGDYSYIDIMRGLPFFWKQAKSDIDEKYKPSRRTNSQWRGTLISGLFLFVLIYIIVASVLSTALIKFALPERFKTENFKRKQRCIIIAFSAGLFALAMWIFSNFVLHQNFFIMATGLLSEYSLLLVVIMLSLIIRLNGDIVFKGLRLYVPITVIGLIVFFLRISFMPNMVVNLFFPPIIIAGTIWQYFAIGRHNQAMPKSDLFYSWISFIVMVVASVMALTGYTLMCVQLLIWWIMQLTIIQSITVIYDLLHRYEKRRIPDDANIRRTWFYDMIYKMIVPIGGAVSVMFTIYWSAKVFDLTEWCIYLFTHNYINHPGLITISLGRLVFLVTLGFVFNYVIYVTIGLYKLWKEYTTKSGNHSVTLTINLLKYVGWAIYVYFVMVTLQVSRTGITLIMTGLSTGIGFAMKDILNNLFYGLQLIGGRLSLGDTIECNGIRGKVKNINYQSTMVETVDGSVIAFPNSQLFAMNFKNMTRNHGYEMATITVGVAYGNNVDNVRRIIIDRISRLKCFDKKKGVQVLFKNFGDSSVDLMIVVWVPVNTMVKDISQIKEEIYGALNEHGIEIPFPQTDLHIKAHDLPLGLPGNASVMSPNELSESNSTNIAGKV